jgi:hypothetical protein
MNCRTNTGVIRSISREQEVLHQCDSPVSHFTLDSHTSSTRDPTRKNFARDQNHFRSQLFITKFPCCKKLVISTMMLYKPYNIFTSAIIPRTIV